MIANASWTTAYKALIERIPEHVGRARMVLGGFSTCLDKYLSLHDLEAARRHAAGTPAESLFIELDRRATSGIDGEISVYWPDGPRWLDHFVRTRPALGGSNSQAAQQLALLGAPALMAISDRSEAQLAVINEEVLIATEQGVLPRRSVSPSGYNDKPPHYIFEHTAGKSLAGRTVPRSSRTIVRFAHAVLEHDPAFDRLSVELAPEAGAGIICGFNGLPSERLENELQYAAELARAWRKSGLELLHFELGDYPEVAMRDRSLVGIGPIASSMGMSLSELLGLIPEVGHIEEKAIRLGETFGLSRVCIHADEWAMVVSRRDPELEMEALMMGCLLASSRAATGCVGVPQHLPKDADFIAPPFPPRHRRNDWDVVCCPSPYFATPAGTIGLGDTFLAGTLLVLGAPQICQRQPKIDRRR